MEHTRYRAPVLGNGNTLMKMSENTIEFNGTGVAQESHLGPGGRTVTHQAGADRQTITGGNSGKKRNGAEKIVYS